LIALIAAIGIDVWRGHRARSERARVLARSGLAIAALGPIECSLRGTHQGVGIAIDHGVKRPLPGRELSEQSPEGTWLAVYSHGPDLIVCRKPYTELLLGALATPPRHFTGVAPFDATFDTLCVADDFDGRSFPPAHCLEALFVLGLHWLQRKGGRLEIMLERVADNQLVSVVALGAAMGGGSAEAAVALQYRDARPGPQRPPLQVTPAVVPASSQSLSSGLLLTLLFGVIAFFLGLFLFTVPTLSKEFNDVACAPGWQMEIVTTDHGGGRQGVGGICKRGNAVRPADQTVMAACGALTSAVVVSIGSFAWGIFLVGSWVNRRR
jgi:hypothetical protein